MTLEELYQDSPEDYEYPWQYLNNQLLTTKKSVMCLKEHLVCLFKLRKLTGDLAPLEGWDTSPRFTYISLIRGIGSNLRFNRLL